MSTTPVMGGGDIVDRLVVEFAGCAPRQRIEAAVAGSLTDLQGIPPLDLPELAERLARQRLLDSVEGPTARTDR